MSDIPEGTSYVHPAEKQCNYSVNLSNYYTKTEIDEMISELEEAMPPSLVGTYDLGSISFNMDSPQPRNLSVTTCDYIEISLHNSILSEASQRYMGKSQELRKRDVHQDRCHATFHSQGFGPP